MRRMRHQLRSASTWPFKVFIVIILVWIYLRYRKIDNSEVLISNINMEIDNNYTNVGKYFINYQEYLFSLIKELAIKADYETPVTPLPIPIFVVEEHHEVIPFWFAAVEGRVLPKPSGITLIHIDAHPDSAVLWTDEDFPSFQWPSVSEWPRFQTSNDEFIVAAGLTGMFSRVVWVWPQWSYESIIKDVMLESISANVLGGVWNHQDAAEELPSNRFCFCGRILNPPESLNIFVDVTYCFRIEIYSKPQIVNIPQSECTRRTEKVRIDILSENEMMNEMMPDGSLNFTENSLSKGFILDIDEDYFGVEAAVLPLYKVGLEKDFITKLSYQLENFLCGKMGESHSNAIFRGILKFLIMNSNSCRRIQSDGEIVSSSCVNQLYQYLQALPTMNGAVKLKPHDVLCEKNTTEDSPRKLLDVLKSIAPLRDEQIQAIADIGICFRVSPETYNSENVGLFRICDGYNRPSQSAVQFYSSDNKEIEMRAQKLRIILNQLPSAPDIVTLCRSVRDGYTPRSKFPLIEKSIIDVLHDVFRKRGVNVKYHRNLLGGSKGWPSRLGD